MSRIPFRSLWSSCWLRSPGKAVWQSGVLALVLCALGVAPAQAQSLPMKQVQPRAEKTLAVHIHYEDVLDQYHQLQPRPLPPDSSRSSSPSTLDIDGLVVDETQTRIGRAFYDAFYRHWQAPEGVSRFTISVQEKPLRGQGVLVTVRVNDELAFQTQLQPRSEFDAIAQQAVAYAHYRLQNLKPQIIL